MNRYIKILTGFVIIIIILGVAVILALPPIVKPILVEKLSQTLHREVSIEKISINPFALTSTIKGFIVKEQGEQQPFVSFDELYINVKGLSSLFKRALILKEIRLSRPYVNIVRHDDGKYNFSDLIPQEQTDEKEKKPFHFSLNNIRILNGSLNFDDQPLRTRHTVNDMDLSIPFVSNISHDVEIFVEPRFSAKINGKYYELAGKSKPFSESKEMAIDLEMRDVDVPYYLNYIPAKLNCRILSATLDAKMSISFITPEGNPPRLNLAGSMALKNVVLNDLQNNKVFRLPLFNVTLESFEPLLHDIHLSKVSFQSPELVIRKSKDGKINLLSLLDFKGRKVTENKSKQPPKPQMRAPNKKASALKARIDDFVIQAGKLNFMDNSPGDLVHISVAPLNLKLVNLSTAEGNSGNIDLSFMMDNQGFISVKGPVRINPDFSTDLLVNAKNIGIRTFQPYFTSNVKIDVKHGAISTQGHLALNSSKKLSIKYVGNIAISNLATMDKIFSNDFVNWKQLYLDHVEAGVDPFSLNIKGISLTDFYARIVVNQDGTLNIKNIFSEERKEGEKPAAIETAAIPPDKKTAKAEDGDLQNIKIEKVTFQGGTVDFTDRFIKPNYFAKMLNIGGSVTGLSSQEDSRATVDLRGNLGYGSPIEIKGSINPLIKDLYADMNLRFKDIELSPTSPYSTRYLGYPIIKGKLTFDVSYLVAKKKLDARNNIFIDQLTFGDKIESPDAIKAPVPLAVSLLTDRNGQINLDIPLSGNLDDPQFRIWPIVWQVVVNIITKAITAPFSLLASLVGGGEELSYVEFDYGLDLLTEAGGNKIASLSKALYERPNLKLDIVGYVDMEKDLEGLKRAELNRKIKAQKLSDMVKKGDTTTTLENVTIEPKEYEKYLALAYKAEKFPKPQSVVGIAKDLPPQEMEKLMLSHIDVNKGDLRLLASRRAEKIKDLILEKGQVASGRIFIIEPQSPSPQKKKNVKESRVDFRLK